MHMQSAVMLRHLPCFENFSGEQVSSSQMRMLRKGPRHFPGIIKANSVTTAGALVEFCFFISAPEMSVNREYDLGFRVVLEQNLILWFYVSVLHRRLLM